MDTFGTEPHPDTLPCPVCGITLRNTALRREPAGHTIYDPSLTTPWARMRFLASKAGVTIDELPKDVRAGLGGAVSIGCDEDGVQHALVALAEDLDDNLRTDILAFGLAMVAVEPNLVAYAPGSSLGIRREALPPANSGIGHVAWHMARSCGRDTPSAMFELVNLAGPAAGERMNLPDE